MLEKPFLGSFIIFVIIPVFIGVVINDFVELAFKDKSHWYVAPTFIINYVNVTLAGRWSFD
jgi:hypothetical protein